MLNFFLRRHNWLIVPVVLLLAAFALRVFRLDAQSIWYDEAFSVYLAHFDLAEITARTAADIQPPFYYYLLHFWIGGAGDSEFALRFLSLFFGVATIPLLYVTALRLFANRTAALIAALLATFSPLYLWYSQEARMYTLITFLLLLSSYALLRELEGNDGIEGTGWVVFALTNIAAIYTHYFAFVVIGFQILFTAYRLVFTDLRSRITHHEPRAIISFALIFISFLPWTPFVIARLGQDASYWQGALKLDEAIRHIFINFTTGESVLESQAQWIAVGWLGCLMVGLLMGAIKSKGPSSNSQTPKQPNSPTIFLILYFVIPLALLLVLFYRNPKFNARYLMIASPAFFLLLSIGIARFSRITRHALRFALYLLAFTFLLLTCLYADANAYFDPAFTKASFRDVAQYIENKIAPDEAIILTSGHLFPAFNYYYHGDAPTIRLPDDPTLNTAHVLGYDTANVLNRTLAGKRGAWVVEWQNEVVDPNGFLPMLLDSQGAEQKIVGTNFYQVRLRHWTIQPNAHFSTEPDPTIRRQVNFKNAIQLFGLSAPHPTPADVGASFNLYWQALDQLDEDYLVALRILDAAGNVWGKLDRRLAGYNYPTTRWKKGEQLFGAYTVPLLAGAPAGDYLVQATIYTASNPSGLDILAPNGAPMGKSITLGPIPVLPSTQPATLASLNIQNTINQSFGNFTLLGYQLGRDKASAGESIPLTLFWRANAQPNRDYSFRVVVGDTSTNALPFASAQYPTNKWRAGEIVRSQYNILIPSNARVGATRLLIMPELDVDRREPFSIDLGPFTIEKTDRVFIKPNAQFTQSVNFNTLALVGYDLSATTVKAGDSLKLVLYWQTRSKIGKPYTVFVHLLDKNNQVVAQKDSQPANGARPTTGWVANEFIADTYELPIKPDAAPGKYQIEIGWYDASDFSRLPVLDESGVPTGDHIILNTKIEVK